MAAATLLLATLAANVRAQTLAELLPQIVPDHPRVKAARANARAAGYDVEQAQAAWAPRFGVVADPGIASRRPPGVNPLVGDVALRATKLLSDGGRSDAETRRQESRAAAAGQRIALAIEQTASQIADAYLECLKQASLAQEAHHNVQAHQELVARVAEIVQIDRGRGAELDQAKARLEQARVTLATRQAASIEARVQLSALTQRRVTALADPGDLATHLPATEDAALARLPRHPAYLAAGHDVEGAREAAAIADAWRHPRVDAQASLMGDTGPNGNHRFLNTLDVRLVGNWTGFDGGAAAAGAQSSRQQMQAALDTQSAVERDLGVEVTRQWSAIQTRADRAKAWAALVDQLLKVRENYWEQFKIGRRSVLDLLNVENEIFQARTNARIDAADQQQARYRALAAMGQLAATFQVPGAPTP